MTVERLGFDEDLGQAVIVLSDLSKTAFIPILIRTTEAAAIAVPLEGFSAPRPLTADLFVDTLDKLDVSVIMVTVTEIRDGAFIAALVLRQGEREIELDSRPSDAIAIALRKGAPIYVSEKVLAEAGISADEAPVQ